MMSLLRKAEKAPAICWLVMVAWLFLLSASTALGSHGLEDGGGVDLLILVDASGSMDVFDQDRLADKAARYILERLPQDTRNRVGVACFGPSVETILAITPVVEIRKMPSHQVYRECDRAGRTTDFANVLNRVSSLFEPKTEPPNRKVVLLLTDGHPSPYEDAVFLEDEKDRTYLETSVATPLASLKAKDIEVYTIGVGCVESPKCGWPKYKSPKFEDFWRKYNLTIIREDSDLAKLLTLLDRLYAMPTTVTPTSTPTDTPTATPTNTPTTTPSLSPTAIVTATSAGILDILDQRPDINWGQLLFAIVSIIVLLLVLGAWLVYSRNKLISKLRKEAEEAQQGLKMAEQKAIASIAMFRKMLDVVVKLFEGIDRMANHEKTKWREIGRNALRDLGLNSSLWSLCGPDQELASMGWASIQECLDGSSISNLLGSDDQVERQLAAIALAWLLSRVEDSRGALKEPCSQWVKNKSKYANEVLGLL